MEVIISLSGQTALLPAERYHITLISFNQKNKGTHVCSWQTKEKPIKFFEEIIHYIFLFPSILINLNASLKV